MTTKGRIDMEPWLIYFLLAFSNIGFIVMNLALLTARKELRLLVDEQKAYIAELKRQNADEHKTYAPPSH
jgi:hypothetical protein